MDALDGLRQMTRVDDSRLTEFLCNPALERVYPTSLIYAYVSPILTLSGLTIDEDVDYVSSSRMLGSDSPGDIDVDRFRERGDWSALLVKWGGLVIRQFSLLSAPLCEAVRATSGPGDEPKS